MREEPRNPQRPDAALRCPACSHVVLAQGEPELPGRRIRCRGCGTWVFTSGAVLNDGGRSCPGCGRAVRRGRRRCPACGHQVRQSLCQRFMGWVRRRRAGTPLVCNASIKRIRCRGLLPRRTVDARSFRILLRSVQVHGILVPLLVRPRGKVFELISGHRRLLAAHRLGLKEVPVIVRYVDTQQIEELRLLEDASHEAWQPLDVAAGIERFCLTGSPAERKRLLEIMDMRDRDLPDMLRLPKAPELLKDAVSLGLLGEKEALRLAEESDPETIHEALGLSNAPGESSGDREQTGSDLVPESSMEHVELGQ